MILVFNEDRPIFEVSTELKDLYLTKNKNLKNTTLIRFNGNFCYFHKINVSPIGNKSFGVLINSVYPEYTGLKHIFKKCNILVCEVQIFDDVIEIAEYKTVYKLGS